MSSIRSKEIEQKEWVDQTRFVEILREWVTALERKQDFTTLIKGESFVIPRDAVSKARFRVEYEIDEGDHEFELTMKWQ